MDLLTKTRRVNRLLQRAGQYVDFVEMAQVMRDVIAASVIVVSRTGKVLGAAMTDEADASFAADEPFVFTREYNMDLLRQETTLVDSRDLLPPLAHADEGGGLRTTVVPVIGGGDRLGTLLLTRRAALFTDEDILLAEYGATVVGMEILRSRAHEIEEDTRSRAVVQMAVDSLSYSELEAIEHIFEELDGREGLLVASKVADRVGITRSVIVNALRKLESAGVIESRSLGMKGTYIKILNDKLVSQLDKVRHRS